MDSGRPFRITRSDDGRGRTPTRTAANRPPETVSTSENSAAPVAPATAVEPVSTKVSERSKPKTTQPKRSSKKLRSILLVIGLCVLLGAGAFFAWPLIAGAPKLPGANEYQAVTLVDGQIYFGRVKAVGGDYIEIDDGYYLQPTTTADSPSGQPDTGKLVRLSNRLYSPIGNIVIPIHQVISLETLDPDGQIVQMMGKEK